MTTEGIDFGAELRAQHDALNARQQELDKERAEWRALASAYARLLQARGKEPPGFLKDVEQSPEPQPPTPDLTRFKATEHGKDRYGNPYDGMTRVYRIGKPRVGDKRGKILLYIAKATREGRETTSREIVDDTGEKYHLVVNTMWQDEDRGLLRYTNGRENTKPGNPRNVVMTDAGFELLEKAGLLNAPPKK